MGGTLHGGQQAAFYDIATSCTLFLIRRPGFWHSAGTSRSLTVTYLRPAFVDERLLMECHVSLQHPLTRRYPRVGVRSCCPVNLLRRKTAVAREHRQTLVPHASFDETGKGRRPDQHLRAHQVQCRRG